MTLIIKIEDCCPLLNRRCDVSHSHQNWKVAKWAFLHMNSTPSFLMLNLIDTFAHESWVKQCDHKLYLTGLVCWDIMLVNWSASNMLLAGQIYVIFSLDCSMDGAALVWGSVESHSACLYASTSVSFCEIIINLCLTKWPSKFIFNLLIQNHLDERKQISLPLIQTHGAW